MATELKALRGALVRDVLSGRVPSSFALQPVVNVTEASVFGYEALFRVAGRPSLSPPDLWRDAWRMGLLGALEDFVAGSVFRLRRATGPHATLFVNADPRADGLAERWAGAGDSVVVELVETATIPERTARALREAGIRFALDDVGTGEASLEALTRLRPDYLKVDRSLVSRCDQDARKRAMIRLLVRYAQETGTGLIAEGVERPQEAGALVDCGVALAQAYWLGRPRILGEGEALSARPPGRAATEAAEAASGSAMSG